MPDLHTIGVPFGTRLLRIKRTEHGWQLWTATRDYIHGTYIMVCNDGSVQRITERVGEGPEIMSIRPPDVVITQLDEGDGHG